MALSCLSPPARADDKLVVGYIPIVPMAPLFVMVGEGWSKQAGLDLELTRFESGPVMVQAMASGKMDAAYVGIGPAMVARANGISIKVLACSVVEQVGIIARGRFLEALEKYPPAEAVGKFTAEQGRKPKMASLPKGAVPDTIGRYWVVKTLGLPENAVDYLGMGESQVQQAFLTGDVDAAAILEPILSLAESKVPGARVVARSAAILPGHAGAVLVVSEAALRDKPAAIRALLKLHIRADQLLREQPLKALPDVMRFVGKGLIDEAVMARAMSGARTTFVSDPRPMIEPTRRMQDFQLAIGAQTKPVVLEDLIDPSLYDAVLAETRR